MEIKTESFARRIQDVFERLTLRPTIGGLTIADSGFQYLVLGLKPKAVSLRLPPGVIRDGRIVDADQFRGYLKQFRGMVDAEQADRPIPVIVVLPPGLVYTQSFQVPNVGAEKLDESAELNLRMISPIPENAAYLSSELIAENPDHYDLLGAVSERQPVDVLRAALEGSGFTPIVFEFPGLALARTIVRGGPASATEAPSVTLQISSDGINLSILRNRSLYFDYFRSWRSIQGEERSISREMFEQAVSQEIRKVLNFALSRFRESITAINLVAPGLEEDVKAFIEQRFGVSVVPFQMSSWSLTPHWYVALGAAFRGMLDRAADRDISLSPLSSAELFREEQTIRFIMLWRNVVASVLAVFLALFIGVAYFLVQEARAIESQLSIFTVSGQERELAALSTRAKEFNALVNLISEARGREASWSKFLVRIGGLTSAERVIISRIDGAMFPDTITITASATDFDSITRFRATLSNQPDFENVNLNIGDIKTAENGTVVFSIVFAYLPAAIAPESSTPR